MKFSIYSAEFKNITERAAVVCLKKGLSHVTSLLIIADKENQRVIIKAANLNSFVEIFSDGVRVEEGGKIFVELENIKRLYNVVGEITVESTNNSIKVRSSKKQGEVYAFAELDEIAFPEIVSDKAFSADKDDMLETFSKLSCCLSGDESRPIFTGFNVAVNNSGVDRIVSCDGYRAVMRKVDWNFNPILNITIPGYIVKELSKVSANKRKENIEVFYNEKYAWFVGNDFTYTTRLLEGKYFDIDKNFESGYSTYGFEIPANVLFSIAKEYSGFLKGTQIPMYVCYINGKLVTAAMSSNYRTSDVLEAENMHDIPENLRYAMNPMYVKDVSEIFEKENIVIEADLNNKYTAWFFKGDYGYTGLILPVKPREDLSAIEEFVASA